MSTKPASVPEGQAKAVRVGHERVEVARNSGGTSGQKEDATYPWYGSSKMNGCIARGAGGEERGGEGGGRGFRAAW